MGDATYPDGTSVAMVAAILEYGAPGVGQRTQAGKIRAKGLSAVAEELGLQGPGIPPRPFIRNMIAAKSGEWPSAVAELLKANNYDAAKTLAQTGGAIAGQLQQSIVDTNSPPLAAATIERKGFDKPLVETGQMLNSVTYKVR